MTISGESHINHAIRCKLRLSVQEYCILSFLQEWYCDEEISPSDNDFYRFLGIDTRSDGARFLIKALIEKGFLDAHEKLTSKWLDEFSANNDGFYRLWTLHKKGNKRTAIERFNKVIKKVPFAELESKLKAYIASNEFVYLKGLDVWLNPAKEHWNDPIVNKKEQPQENKTVPDHLKKMVF